MRSDVLEVGLILLAVWLLVYIARAAEAHDRLIRLQGGQGFREWWALRQLDVPGLFSERIASEARDTAHREPAGRF